MCGIAAIIAKDISAEDLEACSLSQAHRGPDGSGMKVFPGCGFSHQRLAIIDLSEQASQPMLSPCGRYGVVFNGEIYNYKELEGEVRDDEILSISKGDTAIALAMLKKFSSQALERFNGMWSLAFIDLHKRTVLISRDRLGIKPLYYYQETEGDNPRLIFSSEVKTILELSNSKFNLNQSTLAKFLTQSLSRADEQSFFEGIKQAPSASFIELDLDNTRTTNLEFKKFWRHPHETGEYQTPPSSDELREAFFESVKLRLRSDVDVGVLVSGGIDSSAIISSVCSLKDYSTRPLSVISSDPKYNEKPHIEAISKYLGLEPIYLNVDDNPKGLLELIDTVNWHNDEPIWSFSVISHYLLMKLAKENSLKVLLSGQGADEQLAGYNKYFYFQLFHLLKQSRFIEASKLFGSFLTNRTVVNEFKFSEAKRYLGKKFISHNYLSPELLNSTFLAKTAAGKDYRARELLDIQKFSIPKLLHYEDRMSMANGVEVRLPFLDHNLVETLASIPVEEKLKKGWTKYIFRQAMKNHLPQEIAWRKDKKGFSLPEAVWIKGCLKDEISEITSPNSELSKHGLVNSIQVEKLFNSYQNNSSSISHKEILQLFFLNRWLRRFSKFLRV